MVGVTMVCAPQKTMKMWDLLFRFPLSRRITLNDELLMGDKPSHCVACEKYPLLCSSHDGVLSERWDDRAWGPHLTDDTDGREHADQAHWVQENHI